MAKEIPLDDVKGLRLVNDRPIRLLLFAEATSNLGLIFFVFLYPSTFLSILLDPDNEITPLATHILLWWNSWISLITGLMYAAVFSTYSTPTLTAGLVHVRRFLYWALLVSEILLITLLISSKYRTVVSMGFCIMLFVVIIGRLIVLFPKKAWFGTVMIESNIEKEKQRKIE